MSESHSLAYLNQISDALNSTSRGADLSPELALMVTGAPQLQHALYDVSGLATAAIAAAMLELGSLASARQISLNRGLCDKWFDLTLQPLGWQIPDIWDALAGNYEAADGWIRLHTNAAQHRLAALRVLGVAAERSMVKAAVAGWPKFALERAIIEQGGCAAVQLSHNDWLQHPQGLAVAAEPLILWREENAINSNEPSTTDSLKGLRVLDLTRILAGPVATRFLAGFGAEVLRIDPPGWHEPALEAEVTLGKRCAGLNLHNSEDRQVFAELLSTADVLVHGYRPGALDALGFDPMTRYRLNPGLIDVSLSAYGWSGPWRQRRGFDSLVQMSCGITAAGMVAAATNVPQPLPVQALDHATGYLMAAAALRALRLKRASGKILSARLSLARTAALLQSRPMPAAEAPGITSSQVSDLTKVSERTFWGPAERWQFSAMCDGQLPHWQCEAGPLRAAKAHWMK